MHVPAGRMPRAQIHPVNDWLRRGGAEPPSPRTRPDMECRPHTGRSVLRTIQLGACAYTWVCAQARQLARPVWPRRAVRRMVTPCLVPPALLTARTSLDPLRAPTRHPAVTPRCATVHTRAQRTTTTATTTATATTTTTTWTRGREMPRPRWRATPTTSVNDGPRRGEDRHVPPRARPDTGRHPDGSRSLLRTIQLCACATVLLHAQAQQLARPRRPRRAARRR